MSNHEQAVRDAAVALKTAITDAEVAGYRVDLPAQARDLDKVAISETKNTPRADTLTQSPPATLNRPVPADEGKPG